MRASNKGAREQTSDQEPPKALPAIELRHGEALWVMSRLGYQGTATKSTFYEYIKSIRKLGAPFVRGKIGRAGGLANYSYFHLMELALILTVRVYHVVPDSVLHEIIRHRSSLYHLYRRAYAERRIGLGAPVVVATTGHRPIRVRGMFLDLQINCSGGNWLDSVLRRRFSVQGRDGSNRAACSIGHDRIVYFRQGMGFPLQAPRLADDSYRVTLGGGSILIQRIKHLPAIARPCGDKLWTGARDNPSDYFVLCWFVAPSAIDCTEAPVAWLPGALLSHVSVFVRRDEKTGRTQ